MNFLNSLFQFPFSPLPFFGNIGWPPGHGGSFPGQGGHGNPWPWPGNGGGWNKRPTISISDVVVSEGETATFTLTLDHPVNHWVSVSYATWEGTAQASDDYDASFGCISFAPGETEATISIPTVADTLDEADETFFLTLCHARGARIDQGCASATILDNDPPVIAGPLAVQFSEDDAPVSVNLLKGVTDLNGDIPWAEDAGALTRPDGTAIAFTITDSQLLIDPAQFTDLADGTTGNPDAYLFRHRWGRIHSSNPDDHRYRRERRSRRHRCHGVRWGRWSRCNRELPGKRRG